MERTKIAQIFADQEQFGGKEVLVSGWARTIRDMKTFGCAGTSACGWHSLGRAWAI